MKLKQKRKGNANLSVSAVKRKLSVGTDYIGELCGVDNITIFSNISPGGPVALVANPHLVTERRVIKQGVKMISEYLTGGKVGGRVNLNWNGVSAREEGMSIILSQQFEDDRMEDFLKITIKEK